MLAITKPTRWRTISSFYLGFLCMACGGGVENPNTKETAVPTVDSTSFSIISSGISTTSTTPEQTQPTFGAATTNLSNTSDESNTDSPDNQSGTGQANNATEQPSINSAATNTVESDTPATSQPASSAENINSETNSSSTPEEESPSSTTPEESTPGTAAPAENTDQNQEPQTSSESITTNGNSSSTPDQSSSTDNLDNTALESYDVFGGELASDEILGTTQCLNITDTNLDFGEITTNDWRDWLTGYTYSITSEHLQTGMDDGKPYFRQQLIPTSYGSHHVQAGANLSSSRTYRLTQSLYFEPDFDWGGSNEGGKVGFGLGGGSAPTGGLLQTDGFTLRLMWWGNGDGTARLAAYSYAADRSQHLPYGDNYFLNNFEIPVGEWFEVTVEVKANSDTQLNDGSLRVWVGSELALQRDNITWQSSGGQPAIQKLSYTTFYGGNDSTWAPSQTTHIRFGEACWAPVETQTGSLQDDQNALTIASSSVLLEDAIKSSRGQLISTLSNIEVLLPIASAELNSKAYTALDALNLALNNQQWSTDNSILLDSYVVANLALAVNQLTGNFADESKQPYLASQLDYHADSIVNATINIITTEQDELHFTLETMGCNSNSEYAECESAFEKLNRSRAWLANASTEGLSKSEKMRQALIAWTELVDVAQYYR